MKKITGFLILLFVISCSGTYAQNKQTENSNIKMNNFISALMKKMTLDEKIGQLNLVTPGGAVTGTVVSKDVDAKIRNGQVGGLFGITGPDKIRQAQEIAVNNSRLHIPLIFGLDVIHGHKTIFPIPLGLSCSWDTSLIKRSARIAANEATADGLNWVYSPMVDIARDPRWGRIAEGAGEDPFLGSQIAKVMVEGYQENNLAKDNTVMACVKHYALYGAVEAGREYNTVDMSKVKMYNAYLPPYKAAVDAGVGSVMTSFNTINGIPATGNKWLLTDLLRKQWGFKGFVVTDYTAIPEMVNHGMGDNKKVAELALNAGVDMDMVGEEFLRYAAQLVKEGKVPVKIINDACRRILEAKYKLGLFEDPYRYCNDERAKTEIMSDANLKAARDIAERCFVLLKNNNQVLPLKKSGTIALIGPLADNKRNMLGTWSVSGDPQKSVTIMQGIKNVVGDDVNILYAKGANISDDTFLIKRVNVLGKEIVVDPRSPEEMINEAVETANKADVVVAVLGEAADMTGESSSMSHIGLQQSQENLLKALVKTGKPIVLVLMNGRPMTLTWEDKHVPAILDVWFGGTETGNAVADALFGNYNPSGKLTTSFPRNVGQIPIYYNHFNTGRPYYPGEGTKFKSDYLDVPNTPLYPFGYGLSYTTFSYSDIILSNHILKPGGKITASVNVTNTGTRIGKETVQLYIRQMVGSIVRPVEELKGFKQITLQPGETKTVSFNISVANLKFYNNDLKYVYEPGAFKVFIGTNSADVKEADFTLE
ncbi:MAG TPA: beta-glucosidase BglX [Hanamia sp.]|nr:beta-glucosidase BglX [Hanamia sp.]